MSPIKCNCANCHLDFMKKDVRNIENIIHNFCSKKCQTDFRHENKKIKIVQCLSCGITFEKKEAECNKYPRHYCSLECRNKRNETQNTLACDMCNKKILRCLSTRNRKGHNIFCSKICESKFKDTKIVKICPQCKITFKESTLGQKFCSNRCKFDNKKNKISVPCFFCKKEILKTPSQIKKAKHTFCSGSCSGKYHAWKNGGSRRSMAEIKLTEMIKADFPTLEIHENTRNVLDCHLEIDIWIPSIKLAIELNGPCHFMNIYGNKIFQRTITNDEIKKKEILTRGFGLLLININQPEKIVKPLLVEQYQNVIKPMLITSV